MPGAGGRLSSGRRNHDPPGGAVEKASGGRIPVEFSGWWRSVFFWSRGQNRTEGHWGMLGNVAPPRYLRRSQGLGMLPSGAERPGSHPLLREAAEGKLEQRVDRMAGGRPLSLSQISPGLQRAREMLTSILSPERNVDEGDRKSEASSARRLSAWCRYPPRPAAGKVVPCNQEASRSPRRP